MTKLLLKDNASSNGYLFGKKLLSCPWKTTLVNMATYSVGEKQKCSWKTMLMPP